jgi:hypothetical protein
MGRPTTRMPLLARILAVSLMPSLASHALASGIQLTDRCRADDPGGVMLNAARAAVVKQCPCGPGTPHAEHILCARAVADQEAALGHLPQSCKRAVRICAAKTTCGRLGDGWVACCLNAGTGRECRMARSIEACRRMRGTPNNNTPACASCCDACPNPGTGASCLSAN